MDVDLSDVGSDAGNSTWSGDTVGLEHDDYAIT